MGDTHPGTSASGQVRKQRQQPGDRPRKGVTAMGLMGLMNGRRAALVCCQKADPEFEHKSLVSCDQRGWKENPGNTEAGGGKDSRSFVERPRPGMTMA